MRNNLLMLIFFFMPTILMTNLYLSGHKVYAQELKDTNIVEVSKDVVGFDLSNVTLSQKQTEKLKALESDFLSERENIDSERKTKLSEKTTLLKTYPLDAGKIIAKQKEINQLYADLHDKHTIYQIGVLKVLTEEQFKKLNFKRRKTQLIPRLNK